MPIRGLKIIKRKNELDRIDRFFRDESGGAILVGGDRGSGKTTIVEQAIEEDYVNRKPSKFRHLSFHNQIVLRIPLILEMEEDGGNDGKRLHIRYRSLMLRTIARSMESDLRRRRYSRLDLPLRWFRSIGYVQAVAELLPYTNSTSLDKENTGSLSLAKLLSASLKSTLKQTVDISDAVIEMKLRDIFSTYSQSNRIIIVIDELDKLEDLPGSTVTVEDIVTLLKNLFNETGVHVVFISNEKTINRIHKKIEQEPFCIEHTLFKDRILLNNLTPQQLEDILNPTTRELSDTAKRKVIAGLSMATRLMPFEIARFQQRYGIGSQTILQKLESYLGHWGMTYEAPVHVFINHVYTKYSTQRDDYHNRILYKALTEAASILDNQSTKYLFWPDIETLFYTSDLFETEEDEIHAKSVPKGLETVKLPEILKSLHVLNKDEIGSIFHAVASLVFLLDRAGYLETEVRSEYLLELHHLGNETFTIENVKANIEEYEEETSEEKRIRADINKISPLYSKVVDKPFFHKLVDPRSSKPNDPLMETFEYLWLLPKMTVFWKAANAKLELADRAILHNFRNKLRATYKAHTKKNVSTRIDIQKRLINITINSSTVGIYLFYNKDLEITSENYDRIFVLYSKSRLLNPHPNNKVKQINCGLRWRRIDAVIEDIVGATIR